MANFLLENKSVPLPLEFIDNYMVNANATYVKVYLYGLARCYAEENVSNADIAQALDILETDVLKAWRYWKRVGLVHSEGKGTLVFDAIVPSGRKNGETNEPTVTEKEPRQAEKTASVKEITQAMGINPQMKETVKMAEQLLKKTLSVREVTALYNFMQWYNMSQEMVLVLLEYCVTIDKISFAYIEKVAEGWHEQGINTLSEATKVLNRAVKEMKMKNKCKKIFGIERELSQTEAGYVAKWVSELSMSEAMIRNAYERTVTNTGKLSMAYMNTILNAWHEKGIKTVAQIPVKDNDKQTKRQTTYQLDDIAAIERRKRLEKNK